MPTRPPRIHYTERNEVFTSMEPEREAFPLMALAQHHGLPTPLLDWTRRASVAAYFAAADAAGRGGASLAGHLAVWALYRGPRADFDGDVVHSSEGPLFYEAPASSNPNLHAQAGLFTALFSTAEDTSLESYFARLRSLLRLEGDPPLRRMTLPISEAPRLLRLLSYEGVDGASMFPGADGVVRAMRESALWDMPRT